MSPEAERALARNDRYLVDFVEKFDLCPYARTCRVTDALERRVVLQATLSQGVPASVLEELSSDAFGHIEVALLIFPAVEASWVEFERFAARLRDEHARRPAGAKFFVVPFHPDLPPDTDDPGRLVSLLRRSPDPTIQLVRASLLEHVRGGVDPEDTVYLDPAQCDFATSGLAATPPKSVSRLIGEANFATAQRVGAETLIALLSEIRSNADEESVSPHLCRL